MKDVLLKIIEHKRQEITTTVYGNIEQEARAVVRPTISMAKSLLSKKGGIIAEFKRHSPSKKWINKEANVAEIVAGYEAVGAAACSVLTDKEFFKGDIEHLRIARKAAKEMPLLRKEFIIDPRQIYEARVAGADAVLLIAACLTTAQCKELAAVAHSVHLEVLLEIHTASELEYIDEHIDMVGVNNRNLGSFVTDIQNSFKLADKLKALGRNMPLISESGIDESSAITALQEVGFNGFLIGEQFMKTNNPAQALSKLIEQL